MPTSAPRSPVLAADEAPYLLEREAGRSPWILLCDHASAAIPRALGTLGLDPADRARHIAWDLGIAGTARALSVRLDAPLVLQNWSRLVVDCNRPPAAPDAIATVSDGTWIPGNAGLDATAVAARRTAIFEPYHAAISSLIETRLAAARREGGAPPRLLMLHSFTPVFGGVARPWQIGVLYGRDARLARVLLAALAADGRWVVGDNQPYDVSDATDYAVPVHGEARGLVHVELELRQDLLATAAGQQQWARHLDAVLTGAEPQIARL